MLLDTTFWSVYDHKAAGNGVKTSRQMEAADSVCEHSAPLSLSAGSKKEHE